MSCVRDDLTVIGLDLGTKTGICILRAGSLTAFTATLATTREIADMARGTDDPRFRRLWTKLRDRLCLTRTPRIVVAWEDVQFASTPYQFQLWNVLRCAVWAAIEEHGTPITRKSVPVPTLKKFATGSGAADKTRMRTALGLLQPLLPTWDDNTIDAVWVARWAWQRETGELYG